MINRVTRGYGHRLAHKRAGKKERRALEIYGNAVNIHSALDANGYYNSSAFINNPSLAVGNNIGGDAILYINAHGASGRMIAYYGMDPIIRWEHAPTPQCGVRVKEANIMSKRTLLGIVLGGILIVVVALLSTMLPYFNPRAGAINEVEDKATRAALESVRQITGEEFGPLEVKGRNDLPGVGSIPPIQQIVIQDNKYQYTVELASKKLNGVMCRDYADKVKVIGQKSKDELLPMASAYLSKYCPASSYSQYILEKYYYKNDPEEKYHQFDFREVAMNGVGTGGSVFIGINNGGELVFLAVHQGNEKVALETKPELTREKAIEIAKALIGEQLESHPDSTIKAELTVWNNRLAWEVAIEDLKDPGRLPFGHYFEIDALTGDILFHDTVQ